jgi:hypothetical protein
VRKLCNCLNKPFETRTRMCPHTPAFGSPNSLQNGEPYAPPSKKKIYFRLVSLPAAQDETCAQMDRGRSYSGVDHHAHIKRRRLLGETDGALVIDLWKPHNGSLGAFNCRYRASNILATCPRSFFSQSELGSIFSVYLPIEKTRLVCSQGSWPTHLDRMSEGSPRLHQ